MITLRLFKAEDPFQQIAERKLDEGELTIGRDPAVGWTIGDEDGHLSRRHCALSFDGRRIWLRDLSTNGCFLGASRRRVPRDQMFEVKQSETIHLGGFMIVLDPDQVRDADQWAHSSPANDPVVPSSGPVKARDQSVTEEQRPVTDAALLEAFCSGARLDASSFAGEDASDIMRRLGGVYRQIVEDLSRLMNERALLKSALNMNLTTISAKDNNPLKWAPPHRLAVDLLREEGGGFLTGAAAFHASFADLGRHTACMMAGSRAAVETVLTELNPRKLESEAKRQPLHFVSRYELAWRQFENLHEHLVRDSQEGGSGKIGGAFRDGYEKKLRDFKDHGEAA